MPRARSAMQEKKEKIVVVPTLFLSCSHLVGIREKQSRNKGKQSGAKNPKVGTREKQSGNKGEQSGAKNPKVGTREKQSRNRGFV